MLPFIHQLRIPLHKQIFIIGAFIFSLIISLGFIYQYQREEMLRIELLHEKLQTYNYIISQSILKGNIDQERLDSLSYTLSEDHLRITIIDRQGKVVYDNVGEKESFANHADRPEVIDATKKGSGYAMRDSESIGVPFFYSAKSIKGLIIRSALPFNLTTTTYLKVDNHIISVYLIVILTTLIILLIFCLRLGRTISTLREFALKAERDELDHYEIRFPVNDIGAIASHITRLYKQVSQTKKELVVEKEKLMKHLQISKQGLSVFTPDQHPIFTNTLFIQFLNLISDQPISSPNAFYDFPEFERIRDFIAYHTQQKRLNQNEYVSEQLIISKNGRTFDVECFMFQDNTFEVVINNITQLEEENKLKRQLTQNVAHELKTPISSIRGYLETLIENPDLPNETVREFIQRSHSQANRLAGLLKDISVLNRLDEAGERFEAEEINLEEMIIDMIEESARLLKEKRMQIRLDLAPDTVIKGNQLLIYSIFRNLMDNAITYAGEGKQISIKCYHQDKKAYYFSFSDNGVGIENQHLQRIFERFYRVDKGRSRKEGGTGLGLAIVKNAVMFHKGDISAKRSAQGGVEFLFSLYKDRSQHDS